MTLWWPCAYLLTNLRLVIKLAVITMTKRDGPWQRQRKETSTAPMNTEIYWEGVLFWTSSISNCFDLISWPLIPPKMGLYEYVAKEDRAYGVLGKDGHQRLCQKEYSFLCWMEELPRSWIHRKLHTAFLDLYQSCIKAGARTVLERNCLRLHRRKSKNDG